MTFALKNLQEIKILFHGQKTKIAIFSHKSPDGDAVGSGLALKKYLEDKGHEVVFVLPNKFPDFLAWMPESDKILFSDKNKKEVLKRIEGTTIAVFADLNSFSRLGSIENHVRKFFSNKIKIVIDHHTDIENEFDLLYWDVAVSSTSELIYDFIVASGDADKITKQIAESLYVGIITDTGSLSYSCNNESTYVALAHFFKLKIDGEAIHQKVYSTYSEDRIKLLGFSLNQKLKVFPEKKAAYIVLTNDELKKFNHKTGDTEGLVNYTLSINSIQFGALLTEKKNYINISLRSEGEIDVNQIARKFLNGGGHKNAAGADYYGTLGDACKLIEDIINNKLK